MTPVTGSKIMVFKKNRSWRRNIFKAFPIRRNTLYMKSALPTYFTCILFCYFSNLLDSIIYILIMARLMAQHGIMTHFLKTVFLKKDKSKIFFCGNYQICDFFIFILFFSFKFELNRLFERNIK